VEFLNFMEKYFGMSLDYGAKLQKSINMRKKVVELQRFGDGRVLRISTTYGNKLEIRKNAGKSCNESR